MSDLISRQAAIDAMNAKLEDIKLRWKGKVKKGEIAMYLDMRGTIETLPSAQPKKGKWIKADSQQYFRKHYPCFTCSECGYRKDSQKRWNYCPNCGAYMKGTEDD